MSDQAQQSMDPEQALNILAQLYSQSRVTPQEHATIADAFRVLNELVQAAKTAAEGELGPLGPAPPIVLDASKIQNGNRQQRRAARPRKAAKKS